MINLDNHEIEITCPECNFNNPIYIKQIQQRDIVICRGCKISIQLDDNLNQFRKASRKVKQLNRKLEETFGKLGIIEIRL